MTTVIEPMAVSMPFSSVALAPLEDGLIDVICNDEAALQKTLNRLQRNWEVVSQRPIYHPYFFSEWKVEYRSLFGMRKLHKRVACDMHRCHPGFADVLPKATLQTVTSVAIVDAQQSSEEALAQSRELLRRHVIHQLRAWSVPKIESFGGRVAHVAYQVLQLKAQEGNAYKTLVLEMASGSVAKLEEFPYIEEFVNKNKRGEAK